jgi:hypothetical protein
MRVSMMSIRTQIFAFIGVFLVTCFIHYFFRDEIYVT